LCEFVSEGEDLIREVLTNVSIEPSDVDGIELNLHRFQSHQSVLQSRERIWVDVKVHLVRSVFLISGEFLGERIDEVVESHEVGASLRKNPTLRAKIIKLSIESGVLCKETAFVGFSNEVFQIHDNRLDLISSGCLCHSKVERSRPPPLTRPALE
jgi:hypothetical protein